MRSDNNLRYIIYWRSNKSEFWRLVWDYNYNKIALRYLIIKVFQRNEDVFEIADSSVEESNGKYVMAKYLNSNNTAKMFNYLANEKKNCLFLEYSMFNSYIYY